MSKDPQIEAVGRHLREARNILFITGAGLSADSNLPTYRGVGGLYNDRQTTEGYSIEEALSGDMLKQRPEVTWRHIAGIEKTCRHATFNRGHEVIAEMEAHFPRVWVLTQNVDGFHKAAGSRNVINIHGDLHRIRCTRCHWHEEVKDYSHLQSMPVCPSCGFLARPDVVLFEEMLPRHALAVMEREFRIGFDLFFSVGTSSLFPYIMAPMIQARTEGLPTVEINPGTTDISGIVNYKFSRGAAHDLDAIWNHYQEGL